MKLTPTRIWNALKRRLRLVPAPPKRFTPGTKMFLGKTLYYHDISTFHLGLHELFEEETYKFNASSSKPYIVDCGANIGMSILYFKSLYPDAEIVAFEADDAIYGFLEKNMDSYGYKDVMLLNNAVWDCAGVVNFMAEGGAGGRVEDSNLPNRKYKPTNCVRLREYLKNRKVDFLKIDIEGAEHRVLKDCADLLHNVKDMFIEYHSMANQPQMLHEILQIAHSAGFRYHLKEAHTTAYPYIERRLNGGMDLQLNIFCYRE
jgi:FkbM family methyltransferase